MDNQYEKPISEPTEKPLVEADTNYNPNEAREQPYYMQDNQNQNYAPPSQEVYGQNDIYANNNQYPPNQ